MGDQFCPATYCAPLSMRGLALSTSRYEVQLKGESHSDGPIMLLVRDWTQYMKGGMTESKGMNNMYDQEASDPPIMDVIPMAWGYYPHTICRNIAWHSLRWLSCKIKTVWIQHPLTVVLIWLSSIPFNNQCLKRRKHQENCQMKIMHKCSWFTRILYQ